MADDKETLKKPIQEAGEKQATADKKVAAGNAEKKRKAKKKLVGQLLAPEAGIAVDEEKTKAIETAKREAFATNLSNALVEARKTNQELPRVSFKGIIVSFQAGDGMYSEPRSNETEAYTKVEIRTPSEPPPAYIMEYADNPDKPTETIYEYVPIELVALWATGKGGEKEEKEGEAIMNRDKKIIRLKEEEDNAQFGNDFSALEQLMEMKVDIRPFLEERIKSMSYGFDLGSLYSRRCTDVEFRNLENKQTEGVLLLINFIHKKMPDYDISPVISQFFDRMSEYQKKQSYQGTSEISRIKNTFERMGKRILEFSFGNNISLDLHTESIRDVAAEIAGSNMSGGKRGLNFFVDSTKDLEDKKDLLVKISEVSSRRFGHLEPNERSFDNQRNYSVEIMKMALEMDLSDVQMSKVIEAQSKCPLDEGLENTAELFLQVKELFGQETWSALALAGYCGSHTDKKDELTIEAFRNLSKDSFQKTLKKIIKEEEERKNDWGRSVSLPDLLIDVLSDRENDVPSEDWNFLLLTSVRTNTRLSFVKRNLPRLNSRDQERLKNQLNSWGYNEKTLKAESPSAQILERFQKGEVLTEFWAQNFTETGDRVISDHVISFEALKQVVAEMMGQQFNEEDPDDVNKFLNEKDNKNKIINAVDEKIIKERKAEDEKRKAEDEKILKDREGKWERGEGDFRGQGLGTTESLKKCLEDLAEKRGKEVARLTEKEFAEISRDRSAIKEWQIENFYPRFEEKMIINVKREIKKQVEMIGQELEASLDAELSKNEKMRQRVMGVAREDGGTRSKFLERQSAVYDEEAKDIISKIVKAKEALEKEEERMLGDVKKVLKEIGEFVQNPANREKVGISEGKDGVIDLFSTEALVDWGDSRKKYDSDSLVEEIFLGIESLKISRELIRDAEEENQEK